MIDMQNLGLELQYKTCYARVLDSKRKFLQAATQYYELSQVENVRSGPGQVCPQPFSPCCSWHAAYLVMHLCVALMLLSAVHQANGLPPLLHAVAVHTTALGSS